MREIIESALKNTMSFDEYMTLMSSLVSEGKTTGPKQSEDLAHYTKLNHQRMKRLTKTSILSQEIMDIVGNIQTPMTWLVILESWCGDAAQIVPLLQKVAESSELIQTRFVLRDENLDLMDRFLTRGGRSIPKLIILDDANSVLGTWGPRPKAAQKLYDEWRNSDEKVAYKEFSESLQKWYTKDKGKSTFVEIAQLLDDINKREQIAVV